MSLSIASQFTKLLIKAFILDIPRCQQWNCCNTHFCSLLGTSTLCAHIKTSSHSEKLFELVFLLRLFFNVVFILVMLLSFMDFTFISCAAATGSSWIVLHPILLTSFSDFNDVIIVSYISSMFLTFGLENHSAWPIFFDGTSCILKL